MIEALSNPHSVPLYLWTLTKERRTAIKKSVVNASGIAYVFVHPFYTPLPGSDDDQIIVNPEVKAQQERRFVQTIRTSPLAVFVFEGCDQVINTTRVLRQSGNIKPVYFIPTESDGPSPHIAPRVMSDFARRSPDLVKYLHEASNDKLVWEITRLSLSSLGVNNIHLTGRTYPGCASYVEEQLREGFNVTVLPETFPQFYQQGNTCSIV